jgi:hypothetical protein
MLDTRRRFLCACSGVLTLFPTTGHAADAWMEKNPEEWDPEDVQAILSRSSWVKGVNPELSPDWLRSIEKSGKPVTGAEGIRDKRILTEYRALVRWESGLPVRLARKIAKVPQYAEAHYVLSVSRMPMAFMAAMEGGAQAKDRGTIARQMLESSSLQREGKAPIPADYTEWTESDFETRIMIAFPRDRLPVEPSDGVVTFVSQMGFLLLRVSFPLRRMVYRGQLEL